MGIDPGTSGGLALVGQFVVDARKMPETERDLWEILKSWKKDITKAYIERVGPMPSQGVVSVFTFGQSYGVLRAFLIALEVPFEEVAPQRWQKPFSLPKLTDFGAPGSKAAKGMTQSAVMKLRNSARVQKKNAHKAKAQQLFPSIEVTHGKADALLIAEYGRRLEVDRVTAPTLGTEFDGIAVVRKVKRRGIERERL